MEHGAAPGVGDVDLFLSATGLGFIALEMLISLLVVLTFSTRARDPAPRPAQTRRQENARSPPPAARAAAVRGHSRAPRFCSRSEGAAIGH